MPKSALLQQEMDVQINGQKIKLFVSIHAKFLFKMTAWNAKKNEKKSIHQEDAKMIKVLRYVFKTLIYIYIYIWYNVILIFNLMFILFLFLKKILQNVPSFWVKNMTKICWKKFFSSI
jgi:hypothetical protein